MSRKWSMALSIFVASLVHLGLYELSPMIRLLSAEARVDSITSRFKVSLYKSNTRVAPMDTTGRAASSEVRDLLARVTESIPLAKIESLEPLDVSQFADRVGDPENLRQHDLVSDESMLKIVDAKIIEISEAVARKDIEVARRVVAPSPIRVVQKGQNPVLRGETTMLGAAGRSPFPPPRPTTLSKPAQEDADTAQEKTSPPAKPIYEKGVLDLDAFEPDLLMLPVERAMARAPITQTILRETPHEPIDELVTINIESYTPQDGSQGYFRLRIMPKEDESIGILGKDVTFVIDASNSIMQRKLDLTARGVKACIDSLRTIERFNIVVFRDTTTFFSPDLVPASSENKIAAAKFLGTLKSRGSTDLYNAIRPVIKSLPRTGTPAVVFVMSDGRPTSGALEGRDLINAITAENIHAKTIYAFGGGRTVNRYLIDLLAYRNRGKSHVAPRMEDIPTELARFFAQLRDPILTGLRADYSHVDKRDIFPQEIPDFFGGRVVTILGRFDVTTDSDILMRLTGSAGRQTKELVFKAKINQSGNEDPTIAREWAFEKVYYLIGEICRVGERPELMQELRSLSERYDIHTSYAP